MRIDLHCHTKQIKKGDGPGRNVTPDVFKEKIINAGIKIVAITNHNTFDHEQYQKLKEAVAGECAVWPGVEIDIQGSNSKKWHLIVIANPDKAEEFAERVAALFKGKNLETCVLRIQDVYASLNGCDVIYISHYTKTPSITEEDYLALHALVGDSSRVFSEAPNHSSLGVLANHNLSALTGSDVKDWSKYEQSTFAELRLPVENFSQFCLLAKRDIQVVDTLLNKKHAYTLTAVPHQSVHFPLTVFADVNILFGQKGTGKSEILTSLYREMQTRGVRCEKYEGARKEDAFSELLKTKDMEQDLTKLDADGCDRCFESIFNWTDSNPTLFTTYLEWYSTRENSKNKRRMKITDASSIPESISVQHTNHSNDYMKLKTVRNSLSKILLENYLSTEDIGQLIKLLKKLMSSIQTELKADIIDKYACKLANFSVNKIKDLADRKTDTVSKPSSTGFREFAQGRFRLLKNIDTILLNLNKPECCEQEYIGGLEGKGRIYIKKRYRMLCQASRKEEFKKGIMKLRSIVAHLQRAKEGFLSNNISLILSEFASACTEVSVSSTKDLIGLAKSVVTESGEDYSPSSGERGILLLQKSLSNDADAYFLDEPELGMGNSYIDTNIRPLICNLAKQHKVVVVATHNANIAVRTLPYTSIFRTHQNGVYATYVGNPFNDRLVNIDDENDVRSWTVESMHTLEGGKEAFYERKSIYESKND